MHYAKSYPKKTKKAYFLGGKLVVSKVKRLYFTSQSPNLPNFCFNLSSALLPVVFKQNLENPIRLS